MKNKSPDEVAVNRLPAAARPRQHRAGVSVCSKALSELDGTKLDVYSLR